MVIELLITALVTLWRSLCSVIPAPTPPTEFANLPATVQPVSNAMVGVNNWLPVGLLVTVLGIVGTAWLAHVVIKVTRTLVSHLTGGGGAT